MKNYSWVQLWSRSALYQLAQARHGNRQNSNSTKWKDSIELETPKKTREQSRSDQDLGLKGRMPPDCKKLKCYFVFGAKHDGRHNARQ